MEDGVMDIDIAQVAAQLGPLGALIAALYLGLRKILKSSVDRFFADQEEQRKVYKESLEKMQGQFSSEIQRQREDFLTELRDMRVERDRQRDVHEDVIRAIEKLGTASELLEVLKFQRSKSMTLPKFGAGPQS